MLKRELFSNAMKAGLYGNLAWLITAFSVSSEPDHEWKKNPFPNRIVSNLTGHFAVAEDGGSLIPIEDVVAEHPIFNFTDLVTISPNDIPNCVQDTETTYGNWLVNYLLLVNPFGNKIPYMSDDITPDRIESIILKNFKENPKDINSHKEDEFYVSEYLNYVEALYFLTGLTQLCVWTATKKTLLPPPGIAEYKAKLLKQNEGHLDELATIAKIDADLVKYDAEYLKGDPGMNFLSTAGKLTKDVRKKKYLMLGAGAGLNDDGVHGVLVEKSLHEGWDISKFPAMNDAQRAGSFSRGASTQLGGVSVKWLLRASSNMNVTVDDCGSTVGSAYDVTPRNRKGLIGFTVLSEKGSAHITKEEETEPYLGSRVYVRSPMYCKLDYTDYCKTCLGDRLSINPEGLSLAVAEVGSAMLSLSLKAAHGLSLSVAKMNFADVIT